MSVNPTASTRIMSFLSQPVGIMLIDEAVIRHNLFGEEGKPHPALNLISSHHHIESAIGDLNNDGLEVIVLDLQMSELDGLSALPLLLKNKPGVTVIVASDQSQSGAEASMRALELGARDYIIKPSAAREGSAIQFRYELISKIRFLAASRRYTEINENDHSDLLHTSAQILPPSTSRAQNLRPYSFVPPRIIAIGASTGGPQALQKLLGDLHNIKLQVPIVITQHMPENFTQILAENLAYCSSHPAGEAEDGKPIEPGRIYIAPGGKHLSLVKRDDRVICRLTNGPAINFCRPAVDPLFESVANTYRSASLAVILTGMGMDGTAGAKAIAAKGGSVIAQDQATSVVWGMPGTAYQAGVCNDLLPLDQIGAKLIALLTRKHNDCL